MNIARKPVVESPAGDSVQVEIGELVLHGFAPGDRHKIAAAVESELARLMSKAGVQGLGKNSLTLGRINGGAFRVTAGAKPQAAGAEIARAVFRGLRQSARASARAHGAQAGVAGRHRGV